MKAYFYKVNMPNKINLFFLVAALCVELNSKAANTITADEFVQSAFDYQITYPLAHQTMFEMQEESQPIQKTGISIPSLASIDFEKSQDTASADFDFSSSRYWLSTAADRRIRSGSNGKSVLTATEIPLEWLLSVNANGRFAMRAELVDLQAGTINLADAESSVNFGSTVLCQPICNKGSYPQRASGIGLNARYEIRDDFRLDIGTTPLGFPTQKLVGGLLLKGDLGPFGWSIDLSRRPLTSTLLSYAGTRDIASGAIFGGVLATGLRLGLSLDDGGRFGAWSTFRVHQLSGTNVQTNQRTQIMAGGTMRLINKPDQKLTLGLTGIDWHTRYNDGEFTFGHGGYFSPASFHSLAIPLAYSQHMGNFSYLVRASASRSRSQSDSAPWFPTNSAMQMQAQERSGINGIDPHYAASSGGGSGRSFILAAEYKVMQRTYLGLRMVIERSESYSPNSLLFYVRHALDGSATQTVNFPPEAVYSSSQY